MTFSRPALVVLSAIWLVCGVIIGLNPPPDDSGRAQAIPMVGWLLAAFALFVLFKSFVGPQGSARPRHWNGREATSNGKLAKLVLAALICLPMGIGMLVLGVTQGHATHTCLGIVILSFTIPLVPHLASQVKQRVKDG